MEIRLDTNHCRNLVITADNVNIVEDIEERIYPKDADGKTVYNTFSKRDIKDEALRQFVKILDDMMFYRDADFDSSSLVESLIAKLPESVRGDLIAKLNKEYETSDENKELAQ